MSDNQQTEITNETIEQNLETENTQGEGLTDLNENTDEITENQAEVVNEENVPSMEDFEDQIDKSLNKIDLGDIVKGSVVGVSDTEVIVDLGSYAEGVIRAADYSNDPNFSIK